MKKLLFILILSPQISKANYDRSCLLSISKDGQLKRFIHFIQDKKSSIDAIFRQFLAIQEQKLYDPAKSHKFRQQNKSLIEYSLDELEKRLPELTPAQLIGVANIFIAFKIQPSESFKRRWIEEARHKKVFLENYKNPSIVLNHPLENFDMIF